VGHVTRDVSVTSCESTSGADPRTAPTQAHAWYMVIVGRTDYTLLAWSTLWGKNYRWKRNRPTQCASPTPMQAHSPYPISLSRADADRSPWRCRPGQSATAHAPHRTRAPTRRWDCRLRRTIRTRSTDSILSPMRGVRSETRFRQDSCRACPNHDPSSPLRLILPSRIHHRTPTASTRTACRANPGTHARAVSCPRQARELHAAPNQKPGNQARAVSCSISRSKIQIVVIRIHGHTLFMRRVSDHPCGARPTLPT
jgi:hypothetical protein